MPPPHDELLVPGAELYLRHILFDQLNDTIRKDAAMPPPHDELLVWGVFLFAQAARRKAAMPQQHLTDRLFCTIIETPNIHSTT